MTQILKFELKKILTSRLRRWLLILNTLLYPIVIIVLSRLHESDDFISNEIFIANLAYSTIAFTQTYFFIPVWILVAIGIELSGGHVNRVTFLKNRQYYFLSKIAYCLALTLYYTILAFFSFAVAVYISNYNLLDISIGYILKYLAQIFTSTMVFSVLLMALVFIARSALRAFIIYFIWTFLESIIFTFLDGLYTIKSWWLPLHMVRLTYVIDGQNRLAFYHNPFFTDYFSQLLPLLFSLSVLYITYRYFLRRDLIMLSD